jgi:hypothetical protein
MPPGVQSYAYDDDDDYDDALHGYGDNTLDDGVGAERGVGARLRGRLLRR